MKKLSALLIAFFAVISISIAQSPNMKKYHKESAKREYAHYAANLKSELISIAKATGKSRKNKVKDEKASVRFSNKLARLRGDE